MCRRWNLDENQVTEMSVAVDASGLIKLRLEMLMTEHMFDDFVLLMDTSDNR